MDRGRSIVNGRALRERCISAYSNPTKCSGDGDPQFFFDMLKKRDNSKENLSAISGTGNSKNCEHLVGLLQ
jgi:hypothetical protein